MKEYSVSPTAESSIVTLTGVCSIYVIVKVNASYPSGTITEPKLYSS